MGAAVEDRVRYVTRYDMIGTVRYGRRLGTG